MVTITYFVHGTTADNEQHLASGWADVNLSPLGIKQACELGELYKNKSFDVFICSDLRRAFRTSTIAFGKTHHITQDKRLREINYGTLTGQPDTIYKDRQADFLETAFPNGESYFDVEARVRSLCVELKEKYDGKHVALLAHQAPQFALEVITQHKTWADAFRDDWRKTMAYQPGWTYIIA